MRACMRVCVYVCVCVSVRAHVCVCVCLCVKTRRKCMFPDVVEFYRLLTSDVGVAGWV